MAEPHTYAARGDRGEDFFVSGTKFSTIRILYMIQKVPYVVSMPLLKVWYSSTHLLNLVLVYQNRSPKFVTGGFVKDPLICDRHPLQSHDLHIDLPG